MISIQILSAHAGAVNPGPGSCSAGTQDAQPHSGVAACGHLALALVFDTARVVGFIHHRQYQFYSAAESIKAIVNADPHQTACCSVRVPTNCP